MSEAHIFYRWFDDVRQGKYVVVVDDRVVACGESQLEAFQNASQRLDEKRETGIYYIPLPEESLTAL